MVMQVYEEDNKQEKIGAQKFRTEIWTINKKSMMEFNNITTRKFNEVEQQIGDYLRLLITTNQQDDEAKVVNKDGT